MNTHSTGLSSDEILRDLNYSRTQLIEDVRTLRDWLNAEAQLPPSKRNERDAFLINFLIGCKGSIEKSKQKLDNYYSFRSSRCPFFKNYDPGVNEVLEVRKIIKAGVLDRKSDDGTKFVFFKTLSSLTRHDFLQCFQLALMCLEIELRREEITPMRMSFIFDFGEAQLSEFLRVNPFLLKEYFFIIQNVLPIRIKHIIYVNLHPTLALAANYLVKPFLSRKMNERLRVLSTDWNSADECIPHNVIPLDFGGGGRSLQSLTEDFFVELDGRREWFLNDLSEQIDEDLRRPKQSDEDVKFPDMGLDGSFKMLRTD